MQRHHWLGLFALLTLVLAGAAIGGVLGVSDGEGIYFILLSAGIIFSVVINRRN